MREILFRGKRVGNGEWIEGFYAQSGEKKYILIDNDIAVGYLAMKEVNPDTIGQYTGLTDKNGTKIFEGDIVKREYTLWHGETIKTRETQIGVVSYSNKDCGFCLDKVCNLRKPWDGDTLEIIGNIHDSPEKLKIGATAAKF